MKGGKNMGKILQQAQKMQADMEKAQQELASIEVSGESGGGLVKVKMTCRYDVRRVEISDSLVGDDKDMLEDLVAAAVNDAVRRVEQTTQEKMSGMVGAMGGMPGGFKMPF